MSPYPRGVSNLRIPLEILMDLFDGKIFLSGIKEDFKEGKESLEMTFDESLGLMKAVMATRIELCRTSNLPSN